MVRQRGPLVDSAAVQDTIRLIQSLPRISHILDTNPTRKLTHSQYEQLLEIMEDSEILPQRLRFEYTHSKQQFQIRVTSVLHEGIVGEFVEHFSSWHDRLEKSTNPAISRAAEPLRIHGTRKIKSLPLNGRARDIKSPNGGIKHLCSHSHKCKNPALVFEVEFYNNSREALKERAESYITGSKGEIRTVIAVYLGEVRKAERRNERRLRRMYRTNQVNESGLYSYPRDEKNITGEASILIWRAKVTEDNKVTIGRVQEMKFRDEKGNAIQSASLRIPLENCVCKEFIDSAKESKAPPLEISSEAFCRAIEEDLGDYREERASVIREQVDQEKQKKINEEEERLQRATQGRVREAQGRVREAQGRVREAQGRVREGIGRVMERGRLFSARIRDRRFQRELE